MPTADQVKKEFSKPRLLAMAEEEGLSRSPDGRMQCPWRCSDDKRGASVSDSDGYAVWHCQRCGAGGSVVDLVKATRGIELQEAVDHLAARIPHLRVAPEEKKKPRVGADVLWRSLRTEDDDGLAYLKRRGLEAAVTQGHVRFNAGGTGYPWLNYRSLDGFKVAMPLWSRSGELYQLHLRNVLPDDQIPPKEDGKPWDSKIQLPGANPAEGLVMGTVGQARTASTVFLAEGMADTLSLLIANVAPALGAPGTDQVKKLAGFLGDVTGRTIVLCPQNDAQRVAAGKKVRLTSEQAFAELEQQLQAAGGETITLRTPAPWKDPAEWLKAAGADAFRKTLQAALYEPDPQPPLNDSGPAAGGPVTIGNAALKVVQLPKPKDARPRILIRADEDLVVAEAIEALATDKLVFQRDGALVHIVRDASPQPEKGSNLQRKPNAPRIAPLPRAVLQTRLAAVARWIKPLKSGQQKPDHPPDWAVNAVHSHGTWPNVRWLTGVAESPVLRADGSVLDTPGYDPRTGLLYEPSGEFLPVPESPTQGDAIRSVDELHDVIGDFPFAKDMHRSAWLAALFTVLARHAFDGPAPLFLFDSNTRGSGKGKLFDVISLIYCGRCIARMPASDREDEWRKRILSVALAGDPLVLVDNLPGVLGSAALDSVLTATAIQDRTLGGNSMPAVQTNTVWFANGNNVLLKGDLFRRTLHVRLESQDEKPEERTGFKYPELLEHVGAQRPQLLRAALTVLKAFYAAGRPDQKLKPWGSFEAWSRLIRNCIAWLGLPDPWATRQELSQAADTEATLLQQLISAWEELCGAQAFSVRRILTDFEKEEEAARIQKQVIKDRPRLYDVFAEISPPIGGTFNSTRIGARLRAYRGRVILVDGQYKLLDCCIDRKGVAEWRVRTASGEPSTVNIAAGGAGDRGVLSVEEAKQKVGVDHTDNSPQLALKVPLHPQLSPAAADTSNISSEADPAAPAEVHR